MPLRVVLKLNVRNLNQFPLWPHAENYVPSVGNVYTREQKHLFEDRLLLALQFVPLPRLPVPGREPIVQTSTYAPLFGQARAHCPEAPLFGQNRAHCQH